MENETPQHKPKARDLLPARYLERATRNAPELPALNRPVKGIAAYCRRSTEIENDSIERQLTRATEYAERQFKAPIDFKYADAGVSGEVRERDGLNRLLKDAEAGLFNVVIVEEVDRLGRKMSIISEVHDRLERLGVRVHSVSKGDVVTLIDIAFKGFMASEHQVLLRARTKAGTLRAVEEGKIVSRPPFGYLRDYQRPGELLIDKTKRETIVWMYQSRADGMTLRAIAKGANEKLGLKKLRDHTVAHILQNPIYKGIYTFHRSTITRDAEGKRRHVVRHPDDWMTAEKADLAIVDPKLWDEVAKLPRKKMALAGGIRLLSRKCECATCGRILYVNGRGYSCAAIALEPGAPPRCAGGHIDGAAIEAICLDAIRDVLNCDELENEFQNLVNEEFAKNVAAFGPRRKELLARKARLEDQLSAEIDNVALRNFPPELVQQRHRKMTEEWELIAAELADMPDIARRFVLDTSRRTKLLEAFDYVCNAVQNEPRDDTGREEAITALRNLIAGVQIKRLEGTRSYRCTIKIAADAVLGASSDAGTKPDLHRIFEHVVHRDAGKYGPELFAAAYEARLYTLTDAEYFGVMEIFGPRVDAIVKTSDVLNSRQLLDLLAFLATTSPSRLFFRRLTIANQRKVARRIATALKSRLWEEIADFLHLAAPGRKNSFNPSFAHDWLARH